MTSHFAREQRTHALLRGQARPLPLSPADKIVLDNPAGRGLELELAGDLHGAFQIYAAHGLEDMAASVRAVITAVNGED